MNVLITGSRLPHALGVIRHFGEAGHNVIATDTFKTSPGLSSKYTSEAIITAAPAFETEQFIAEIKDIIRNKSIDLVVPCFEEVFYLAQHLDELSELTQVFSSSMESLSKVHNKETFTTLTEELGVPIAKTMVAKSDEELQNAIDTFPEYFGRAAFSRGGVELLTNTGPLAGVIDPADVHPTPKQPWILQEFVHGEDMCSFTIAHHGKIALHCTYQHPMTIEHAGGIVFESIDEPRTLEIAKSYIEATGYHGMVSFDYMRSDKGMYIVECNPRPTSGIFCTTPEEFSSAVFEPNLESPTLIPAGRSKQIGIAILRDMFRDPGHIPDDLNRLINGSEDVYAKPGDMLPGLYQILSYSHVLAFRKRMHVRKHKHSDIMEAQFFDISWNG